MGKGSVGPAKRRMLTAKVSPALFSQISETARSSRMSRSAFVRESLQERIDRPTRILLDGRIRIFGVLVHVELHDSDDESSLVLRGPGRDKLRNAFLDYLKRSLEGR